VRVLGTQFDIRALPGDVQTTVLVREGKVQFKPSTRHDGVLLGAADKAVLDLNSAEIRRSKVQTFNDLAWHTGGLEFVSTPLAIVIADLEKYYKVSITLQNPNLRQCLHTAPLTSQPVEQVLEALALTYQLKVKKPEPGKYVLSGGVCQ